jgi:hypothetical protein
MPHEFASWDELVATSSQGTLFHKTTWLQAAGQEFSILGCYSSGGDLVAGIPVPFSRYLSQTLLRPPYFVPYSGPVVRKVEGKRFNQLSTFKKIVEPLAKALATNYAYARINMHYSVMDIQPFLWQGFVPFMRYTYLVRLENMDTVLKEADVDRRNDIHRGIREGFVLEENNDLQTFIPMLYRSLAAQNVHWSKRRLREFTSCFNASTLMGNGKLFGIRNADGRFLAGAWLTWDERCAYYLLTGMDRDTAGRTGVPTLIWYLMCFTRDVLGLEWFDFNGADVPQIEGFVRAFGGHLTPYLSVLWVSPLLRPFWLLRRVGSWGN